MKLSSFLTVKAIVSLIFGLGALLVPVTMAGWFGATLNPAGASMTSFFGALLLGVALICWSTKGAPESSLQKGVLLALFVADTLGFIVALMGQLSGLMNALGWVNVVLWLLLALGLGYFRFIKPGAA